MTSPICLHIEGRRWFRRSFGNTYTSVRIFLNGEQIATLPPQGGYGDHYLTIALEWLKAEELLPKSAEYGTRYLRENVGATYSVVDVARERDL